MSFCSLVRVASVATILAVGCAPHAGGTDAEGGPAIQDEALASANTASNARGWRVDSSVAPQVGVFFGREGLPSKEAAPNVATLSLPAPALTSNEIPLFDVKDGDLAQVDFFRAPDVDVAGMFRGFVKSFDVSPTIEAALRPALASNQWLLKEVRLRTADAPELPHALSRLPQDRYALFGDIAYVTVFVTKPAGATRSALESFRDQIAEGEHLYTVGGIVDLPPGLPHPQTPETLNLVKLMTVRLKDRLHGRSMAIEVIETEPK